METNTFKPIVTQGKAFCYDKGDRFMVRGVALSPNSNADLLGDNYYDYMNNFVIPKLTYLNVNVIRVYQIDETQDHSKVMYLLQNHGIYVMVGMVTPSISVNRMNPQYTTALYNRITKIADEFAKYDNTFAFSVGNEVVFPGNIYANTTPPKDATLANEIIKKDAAVMKSMIRDVKAYMKTNKLRMVPVGMAMQDGPSNTVVSWKGIGTDVVAAYYAGGKDISERADFIGINEYRYLNTSVPGPMNSYDGLATEVAKLPVPVFLTESGGITRDKSGKPLYERDWAIISHTYSEKLLTDNLSGQIAFQFFNKQEDFGLYTEDPVAKVNPCPKGKELGTTKYGGAANLSTQYKKVKTITLKVPLPLPDPTDCPKDCNPNLLPCPGQNISITIENFATSDLKAVQNGSVIADLPKAASNTKPSLIRAKVSGEFDLLIQDPNGWSSVCQVKSTKLKDGLVVKNNVPWGNGVSCTI